MQFVPARKPRSAWRALILFLAALLTFGLFVPATASPHGPALLRIHDKTVVEPDYGYSTFHVKISLDHRVNHRVSVWWYTLNGTAKAGSDYRDSAGRAFIPAGHKFTFAHVRVYGDKKFEPNEFFKVRMYQARGALLPARRIDRTAIVTILNDDPPVPALTVHRAYAKEGKDLHFWVSLDRPAPWPVRFSYAAKDGTATEADGDYKDVYDQAVIYKGRRGTLVEVETLLDTPTPKKEGREFLILKVFHVHGATVVRGSAPGFIFDTP